MLPGGESTTISMGLERHGLFEPIEAFVAGGGRVLGTCAGAILLARESRNHPVRTLGLLDAVAERLAAGETVECELNDARFEVVGVFEQYGARKRSTDFSKGRRLGARDHLITMSKPKKRPDWMSASMLPNSSTPRV